jgi:hypothetical protein
MILVVLKYVGLCLAAGSSVWGTIHNLTIDSPDGRRRITKAGFISIGLTILGLVVGVVSEDLQRRQSATEQSNQVTREAKRTNEIIIAAQPLASLFFSLSLRSSDESLLKQYKDAKQAIQENAETSQGGVPSVPFDTMEYESELIPFLRYLAVLSRQGDTSQQITTEQYKSSTQMETVFAILPLDDSANTVLSFGRLENEAQWYDSKSKFQLSTGFLPINSNARPGNSVPHLQVDLNDHGASNYRLTWDLDPVTLENAINRGVEHIRATGKLPPKLEFAIFTGDEILPFGEGNFAESRAVNLWRSTTSSGEKKKSRANLPPIVLTIQVNGFTELTYSYRLVAIEQHTLYDREEDEFEISCALLRFVREREE